MCPVQWFSCNGMCNMFDFTSSPPSDAYVRQWIRSALVQIMACRLIGAKPLSQPMLGYCQLDPKEQTSVKFLSKYKIFHSQKCIWKHRLRNGGHFDQGEMSQHSVYAFLKDQHYATSYHLQSPHQREFCVWFHVSKSGHRILKQSSFNCLTNRFKNMPLLRFNLKTRFQQQKARKLNTVL